MKKVNEIEKAFSEKRRKVPKMVRRRFYRRDQTSVQNLTY